MKLRSIFISDVHLGSRACNAALLGDFLASVSAEYLFLVGDLIDMERLARRWHWPHQHGEVLETLLARARQGARVYYIPGNHDGPVRQYAGVEFGGVKVVAEHIHHLADGRRLLIMHGDQFDHVIHQRRLLGMLGSWAYCGMVYANRRLNAARRLLGLEYWSLASCVKRRNCRVRDMAGNFKQVLCQHARARGCDGVMAGHIHTAEIDHFQDTLYCNTGDWVESCTAILEDHRGQLELITWPEWQRRRDAWKAVGAAACGQVWEDRLAAANAG